MRAALFTLMFSVGGVCILAALDSTVFFFLPLAVDIGVVLISSRRPDLFWLYPLLVAASSLGGTVLTFYLGRRIGEAGLENFVSPRRLKWARSRLQHRGAVAMAAFDLIPPPFPFTAVILTAAALDASAIRFFIATFGFRVLRFGAEAVLAAIYGKRIAQWMQSDLFRDLAEGFTFLVLTGAVIGVIQFIRKTRADGSRRRASNAA